MEQETISHKCNVCCCDYTDDEGGIQGYFGILPVSFCPTCFSSMCDMAGQFSSEPEEETIFDHLKGFQYIVVNSCHGGFGLSHSATILYLKKASMPYSLENQPDRDQQLKRGSKIVVNNCEFSSRTIARNDPILIDVVTELKSKANGDCSRLKIVKVPAGVDWIIEEYDGMEWVAEKHRIWE